MTFDLRLQRTRINRRKAVLTISGIVLASCGRGLRFDQSSHSIRVGGKNFTEQRILSEIVAQHLHRVTNLPVETISGLDNANQELWNKRIDMYVEYSGTAWVDILHLPGPFPDRAAMTKTIKSYYRGRGLEWFDPLGFQNEYAFVIRKLDSDENHILTLSQAGQRWRAWRIGDGPDFQLSPNGLGKMLKEYRIHLSEPPLTGTVDGLYKLLQDERVDMIAANSTDRLLNLDPSPFYRLQDDHRLFPPYEAAIVARADILQNYPMVRVALQQLSGRIDTEKMLDLNNKIDEVRPPISESEGSRVNEGDLAAQVAREFLDQAGL